MAITRDFHFNNLFYDFKWKLGHKSTYLLISQTTFILFVCMANSV